MTVEIDEYGAAEIRLSPEAASALQATAGAALTVTPSMAPGHFLISASSYVGVVRAADVEVRIRPKVPVDNVLFLLGAGWDRDWIGTDTAFYERSELTPAFAAVFARAVTKLLRRGEQQDYVEITDDLDTIRGRIDLKGQFQRPGRLVPVTCQFSEFTADTELNRYLKHAVRLALRVPGTWARTRKQLRHALAGLDRVSDRPPPVDLPLRFRYTRLNRGYEPVLRLAHILRRAAGLGDQQGELRGATFLLNMNQVFERFVEQGLRRELRGVLAVDGQHTDRLDLERLIPIRPDLVFRGPRGEVLYVGDAKYKLSSDGLGRSSDYFQLHAYCTRFGLSDGVLIYGTEEAETRWPRSIVTAGDGVTLRTLRLPLMGAPVELQAALRRLAESISGWVSASAAEDGASVGVAL